MAGEPELVAVELLEPREGTIFCAEKAPHPLSRQPAKRMKQDDKVEKRDKERTPYEVRVRQD
jgi:hypothetical protein